MIFLDFDGTMVDVWKRYFQVFCAASETDTLKLEDYIPVKRQLCKDDLAAAELGISLPPAYYTRKEKMLEEPSYLALDALVVPVEDLLLFFRCCPFRILTVRREAQAFYHQLEWLGLSALRESSIVLNPREQISKCAYLQAHFSMGENILVGDSASEWEASKLENTTVFLVRSGLRNPDDFNGLGKCKIIKDLSEFIAQYRE